MEVHVRREVNKYYVLAIENMEKKCFVSGSRGEGFQFDWSDIDLMSPLLRQTVFMESLHHECNLTARREGCSPGFCKVFFTNANNNYGTCYSRNLAFKMIQDKWKLELKNISLTIHGPCVQTYNYDVCYALPIHPDSSKEFFETFTKRSVFWKRVLSNVIRKRMTVMHCVPKGPEEGDNEGTQWLISFSSLEQHIVHSFNHVQFCCYGFMKIILHEEIDLNADTRDTLSSYHIKTVLFHVLEDIHADFWIAQNIISCVHICLTRLLLYVTNEYCPNYFIPEANLFFKKRIIEKKDKIQKKLQELLHKSEFRKITIRFTRATSMVLLKYESNALQTFNALCNALDYAKLVPITRDDCISAMIRVMYTLQLEKNQLQKAILNFTWLSILRRLGVILYDEFAMSGSNSSLLSAKTALMFARHSDIFCSVYLATLYYLQGKYEKSIGLLSEVTSINCFSSSETRTVNLVVNNKSLVNKCRRMAADKCDYTSLFEKHYYGRQINIRESDNFFPKDLENHVKMSGQENFYVKGESYAYFLIFLCYYETGDQKQCLEALNKLLGRYLDICRIECYDIAYQRNSKALEEIAKKKYLRKYR